jgi:hypothetical protein
MIQLNGAQVTISFIRGIEVGVAVFKATNVACVERFAASRFEIDVTFGASLIASGDDVDAPAVFGVTRCARRACRLCGVMDGSVVAVEASVVRHFRGKYVGLLHMARGTFLFKNGVWLGKAPAAVNARIFEKSAFRDPEER